MDHLVRVGLRLLIVPEEWLDLCTTDFGPVDEWALKGAHIVGRLTDKEDKEDLEKPLPFEYRGDLLSRMPHDADTVTREEYYRRDNG